MGRSNMRILITGLPLFSKRLRDNLTAFDRTNRYFRLDTYYSRWDRMKAFFLLPFCKVLYSINGTLGKSRLVDLALLLNKRVMMTWVGTDVLKAKDLEQVNPKYRDQVEHYCEVDWIRDELKELGINAEILNFVSFDKRFELVEQSGKRLTVLTYIGENREAFYGIHEITRLAESFPEVDFFIAGTTAKAFQPLPGNVKPLGWVDDMDALFNQSDVCIRFPEHDGLSSFVLESLARGKHVLYKYPLPGCRHTPDEIQLAMELGKLHASFTEGALKPNLSGKQYIEKNFNASHIFGTLKARLNGR